MDLRPMAVLVMYGIAAVYVLRGGAFAALQVYMWIAYFRPSHWAGWSELVGSIPMSYSVGLFLVASTLLSPSVKVTPRGCAWGILGFGVHAWLSLALTPLDLSNDSYAWWGYRQFANALLVAVMMTLLVTDRHRFKLILLVMTLSLSLDGAKQGWVYTVGGGGENLNSIPFLGDNNHVAVGVLMMAAVLGALLSVARTRLEKLFHATLLVGMVFRALTTYSRGGFLALGALAISGLMYTRRRLAYLLAAAVVASVVFALLPSQFWDRMKTITPNVAGAVEGSEDEELDQSAQSRVHFWRVAVRMAADRPFLGVGFLRFAQAYPQYDTLEGSYGRHRAVHSAWFAALAETGVVGFLWFGSMLVGAIVSCWRVRRLAQHNPDLAELSTFAAGLNTAFMTFIVGATFVTLTYSDLLWHMMTLAFLLHRIAKAEVAAAAAVRPAGAAAAVEQAIQLAAPFSDRPRIAASR